VRGWIAVTAFVAAVLIGGATRAETLEAQMQALLDRFHAEYGFPGATAAISLPDGSLLVVATGLADVESETPMTPQTPMLAASIGKTFVGATVLALEADGALARADLVSDYLGDRAWFTRLPNNATMTVGDLLRHTAGLPDHVHLEPFEAEMARRMTSGAAAFTPEEAIAFVFDAEPLFGAGDGWAYTDTGYLLLGLVIETASGRSYYDLVSERLLDPLGLADTRPSSMRKLDGLAAGYVTEDNPFGLPPRTMDVQGTLLWDPAMEWTGGGLVSTSRDLAFWGLALFTGRALDAPYLDSLLDGAPVSPDAPDILYGAGVAIYSQTSRGPVYGHGGWIPGYVSSLRHYADHGVTVAFQINTDVGVADDSTNLVPALEAALADLAVAMAQEDETR